MVNIPIQLDMQSGNTEFFLHLDALNDVDLGMIWV